MSYKRIQGCRASKKSIGDLKIREVRAKKRHSEA